MQINNNIKKIALLTSGGDAPGMNATIRAIVRTAIYNKLEVMGIVNGYSGLLNKNFIEMQSHSVSKILSRGGTILKSSRCPEFKTKEGREKAYKNLKEENIDALIVNGGDGSFRGADLLEKEFGFPVIGIPLPFFSYGGSSTLINFVLLGLVFNISMRRYVYSGVH